MKKPKIWHYKDCSIEQIGQDFLVRKKDNLELIHKATSLENAKNFIFEYSKKEHKMTNEKNPQPFSMTNIAAKEMQRVLDNQAKIAGYENAKDMTEKTKNDLQSVIVPKDELKLLKVLDKPTDTETRLVWITRTILFEYSRGKKGCYIPLSELGISKNNHLAFTDTVDNVLMLFYEAGYGFDFIINKELIGDCFEIVWG